MLTAKSNIFCKSHVLLSVNIQRCDFGGALCFWVVTSLPSINNHQLDISDYWLVRRKKQQNRMTKSQKQHPAIPHKSHPSHVKLISSRLRQPPSAPLVLDWEPKHGLVGALVLTLVDIDPSPYLMVLSLSLLSMYHD